MCKIMTTGNAQSLSRPFRVAHLSDVHQGPLPEASLTDLLSKRVFGYLNWHRNRGKTFTPETTDRLVDDLKQSAPDHIVVTGDLVNIALESEFERAGAFLHSLGSPEDVTVIPGNHDAYVPGALERFNHHCAPFLTSDKTGGGGTPYPVLRKRGPLSIIGLSSAIATAPLMATGHVKQRQLEVLESELSKATDAFGLVLVHHPPFPKAGPNYKRLVNEAELRNVLAKVPAHLVLHGHTHLPTRTTIDGPKGLVPVFGVASAAQAQGGHRPPASYTLFDIEAAAEGWSVKATRRGYAVEGSPEIVELSSENLDCSA